ncbi:MAG: hypothetical protein V8Q38_02320, partial [Alistipes putredinis]
KMQIKFAFALGLFVSLHVENFRMGGQLFVSSKNWHVPCAVFGIGNDDSRFQNPNGSKLLDKTKKVPTY